MAFPNNYTANPKPPAATPKSANISGTPQPRTEGKRSKKSSHKQK